MWKQNAAQVFSIVISSAGVIPTSLFFKRFIAQKILRDTQGYKIEKIKRNAQGCKIDKIQRGTQGYKIANVTITKSKET
jgi:hypothetical protein